MANSDQRKPKEIFHDEAPSIISDHAFEPRAQWWTLCKHCGMAESAHKETKLPFRYFGDDMSDDEDE
jgi:hypothetical protein